MRRLSAILLCILLAALPGVGIAAPYERSVFQYTPQRWSAESDAPRPIMALAQDQHGYLWVASATGLFRFNGFGFEPIGRVDLAVNGTHAGELLPLYVRDNIAAELHRIGVTVTPYARLYGSDGGTVYMQHTVSEQPILFETIDTLVLCLGHEPVDELSAALMQSGVAVHLIGDSMAPRTAEEAVYEGLKVAAAL